MRHRLWKPILIVISLLTTATLIYFIVTDKPKPYVWGYYRGTYCATTSDIEGILNSLSTTPDPDINPGQVDNGNCHIKEGELYSLQEVCPPTLSTFLEGEFTLTFCQKAIFEDVKTR